MKDILRWMWFDWNWQYVLMLGAGGLLLLINWGTWTQIHTTPATCEVNHAYLADDIGVGLDCRTAAGEEIKGDTRGRNILLPLLDGKRVGVLDCMLSPSGDADCKEKKQ